MQTTLVVPLFQYKGNYKKNPNKLVNFIAYNFISAKNYIINIFYKDTTLECMEGNKYVLIHIRKHSTNTEI